MVTPDANYGILHISVWRRDWFYFLLNVDLIMHYNDDVEKTVNDIPDEELLRRAVSGAANTRRISKARSKVHLWVAIMDMFLLGSSYSQQLCTRFGFNPDDGSIINKGDFNYEQQ